MNEETITASDVFGLISIGVFLGMVITLSFMHIAGGALTGKRTLAQKCAETQGKYDFCVQRISYEVKQ